MDYNQEFKEEVVHLCVDEGISKQELVERYDISESMLIDWVKELRGNSDKLTATKSCSNQYSKGFKLDLVYLQIFRDCSFKLLAEDFGVDAWTIRDWCKKYRNIIEQKYDKNKKFYRYSEEFKKKVVTLYIDKGATTKELYAKYKIKDTTVAEWSRLIRGATKRDILSGKVKMMDSEDSYSEYTEEFKKDIVKLLVKGESYKVLIEKYGIGYTLLHKWYKEYKKLVLKELRAQKQAQQDVLQEADYYQAGSNFSRRYSVEFKKKIVKHLIDGKTPSWLVREYGVSFPIIRQWDKTFRNVVLEEVELETRIESQQELRTDECDRYDEEFSKKIVRMLIGGWSVSTLKKEYNLTESTIKCWDKKYRNELLNTVAEDNTYNIESGQLKEQKPPEANNILASNPNINLEIINEFLCAVLNQSDITEQGTNNISLAKYRTACMSAKKLEKERVGLLKQNVELQQRNFELNNELFDKDKELSNKNAQLTELNKQHSELSAQLLDKDVQISKFRSEVSRLQEEITILKTKVNNSKQRDNYFREVFSRLIKEVEE